MREKDFGIMKKTISKQRIKKAPKKAIKKTAAAPKRKILIVNYEFPPLGGGGGVATYDLAIEWAKNCQVDVLTSSFKDLPKFEVMKGINVYRVPVLLRKSRDAASFISMLSYLFFGFFKGFALCRRNHYQVINTHFAIPSGPLGYLFGKMFSIRNVLSLHGGDIYDPSKKSSPHKSFFFKRVVRFILNRADRIVAQSSNTKGNAVTYYKPGKEIEVIPLPFHPFDIPKFSREEAGFAKKDFIIIAIGRIVKRKGYDVLIRALFQVRDPQVKLVILGDGPEKANLQNLADYLGLRDRVTFAGFVDEPTKFRYLGISDLFALTSLHEGFGIVFMEAMHCGLPIVCTNHGGQTDFLVHKENALLLNVGDIAACTGHIIKFRDDKRLYKKCSVNNIKKVKTFYADIIASQYMKIFAEAEKPE
jgi:L-malate glycosyltransferase